MAYRPGKQFASDITRDRRQMFVAKVDARVVATPMAGLSSWQPMRRVQELRLATTSAAFWWNLHGGAEVSRLR